MSTSAVTRRLSRTLRSVLPAATLALTLSRAWRWPNDFAEAHWLLDYRFGFVKRGLAGQVLSSVLRQFHARPTAVIISAIAIALLTVLSIVLLWTAWEVMRTAVQQDAALLVSLAFVSSPFIVMTAHLVGYLDGLLMLLTVVAVALMLRGKPWMACLLQATAVLVHESAILVGFPVLCLAWWATRTRTDEGRTNLRRALPLVLPALAFGALALSAGRLPPDFQNLYSLHLMNYPFVGGDMHIFVPEWLTPGFAQQVGEQKRHFAERITSPPILGLVLPTVLVVLVWTMDACRVRARSITMALLIGATFAPQLMHMAAWDTMRIWTYSIAMAWLGAWILTRTSGAAGNVSAGVRGLALLALVVNVMMGTFLLDNLTDRYTLTMRLLLFAPMLLAALVLFLRTEPHAQATADLQ